MPGQRRTRGFSGARRGATDWGRLVSTRFTILPGAKALLATFTLTNPGISETVRRTRGRFEVLSDQGSLIEAQDGALGMIVVSDRAVAAGAASIPGPITDASDEGWFVWEGFVQHSREVLAGSVSGGGPGSSPYAFDSKAMRKVAEGFTIAVMAEATAASGGIVIALAVSLLGSRT